jgi:uncharacterized RDD family membrane protein YckC
MESLPAYARFSRRFRAFCFDVILFVLVFYIGAVVIHSISPSDSVTRSVWLAVIVAVVLYEPILVSTLGGTVGHRVTNLRVVDDRRRGNLSFGKAVVRMVIKDLLGWYSFLSMTLTRRNQAVHDVLTHSTVQIRDKSKARASQYVVERKLDVAPGISLPSRSRRVIVIVVYILLGYLIIAIASAPFLSDACAFQGRCSGTERAIGYAIGGLCFALVAIAIVLVGRVASGVVVFAPPPVKHEVAA